MVNSTPLCKGFFSTLKNSLSSELMLIYADVNLNSANYGMFSFKFCLLKKLPKFLTDSNFKL